MIDLQSLLGYSKGSPYAGNPYLDIHTPEGLIDMSNTPFDLLGIDNKGNKKKMKANSKNPYKFEGNMVREIPFQTGGRAPIIVNNPNDPRLKAYSDSLIIYNGQSGIKYNNAVKDLNKINKTPTTFYGDGFPKPVQPVVYQKPEIKDALGYKPTPEYLKKYPPIYLTNPKDPRIGSYNEAGNMWLYQKPQPKIKYTSDPNDPRLIEQAKADKVHFGGLDRIAYKPEQLFPLQPAIKGKISITPGQQYPIHQVQGVVKGNINIQSPQQTVIPEPSGQPVYGPSNGLIGYQTSTGFQPTLRRDHLSPTMNKADIDLLSNPTDLQKYVNSTPRYKKGGINAELEYTWSKNSVQRGGNPFSKRDILNFLFEGDDKKEEEDVPTAPTTEEVPDTTPEENNNVEDSDYDLAMQAANGEVMGNPFEQPVGSGNPYAPAKQASPDALATLQEFQPQGFTNLGIFPSAQHHLQNPNSDHETGKALDLGVKSPVKGDEAVAKLQSEAQQRNIKYIIWNGKIWNPSISSSWRPYVGKDSHTTHIHVSFK